MEFPTDVVHIDNEWKFGRADLYELKDSENGCLKGECYHNFIIPGLHYNAKIYPNGFYETYRGETIIALDVNSVHEGKIHANFVILVESAGFSKESKCIIETSGGEGEICCKTSEFFSLENNYFITGVITVRIKGTLKAEYSSSTHIICPFDIECSFEKSDLSAIKNFKNGYLNGKCFYAFNIPSILFHITLSPNGDNEERRGETVISLRVNGSVERNVTAVFTIIIESINFSKNLKRVYEAYSGGGGICCKTEEFFNTNNKYFIDDIIIIRIKGTLKTQQFFTSEICCPFDKEWKFKKSDLMNIKDEKNERLKGRCYHEDEIPGFEYGVSIYPNGNSETYEGETWIILHAYGIKERKITAIFTIYIESAIFLKSCVYVYDIYAGTGSACCKTNEFFDPNNNYFVDDEITVRVEGIFKIERSCISDIICPFDIEWKLAKADLIELKDSENGYLAGKSFYAFNIPGLQYYAVIYPNGNNNERRGQTWIFLYVNGLVERKITAYFTIFIESASYSHSLNYIYETNAGWGHSCCNTAELFDLQSKYFANGELVIRIKGNLNSQRSSISKTLSPIAMLWKIKEQDLLAKKETNGFLRSKRMKVALIPDVKMYAKISLNEVRDDSPPKIGLYLYVEMENQKKIKASFDFSIYSAHFHNGVECTFEKTEGYGFLFCFTNDLFDASKSYIVNGYLTINLNGILMIETAPNTVLNFKKGVASKCAQIKDAKDFLIVTGDKEIKVHKQVLMDASEAFIGMFKSGMIETIENKMFIKEFPFEIVEAAINLMYNVAVPRNFVLEDMLLLYRFADKYRIQLIMNLVENYLIKQLSPANVCKLIKFSEPNSFNIKKLHQSCVNFLIKCSKKSTPVSGIEILNNDFLASVFLNSLCPTVETDSFI